MAQMKVVEDSARVTVSAVTLDQAGMQSALEKPKVAPSVKTVRECWNCGRRHEYHKKEFCPAYGKICNKCLKPNHFAVKCRSARSKGAQGHIKALEEDTDEVFPTQVAAVSLDDAQFVSLRLESGKYLQFQIDMGAQCNVIPVTLYKKATKDFKLVE